MVHESESLSLCFEAGQYCLGVQAGLEHLESDAALDWIGLLSDVDLAEAAFADQFENLVVINSIGFLCLPTLSLE